MEKSSRIYHSAGRTPWEDLGSGVHRQIFGWDERIMMVRIKFEKGSIGNPHAHMHSQTTYCISGIFQFTIDKENYIIREGDALYIPPDAMHGTICLEEGMLMDVFSPMREDFLG